MTSWRTRASASAAVGIPCGGAGGAGVGHDSTTVAGAPAIEAVVAGMHPGAPAPCAHGAVYHHDPWGSMPTVSDGAVPSVGPTLHAVPS